MVTHLFPDAQQRLCRRAHWGRANSFSPTRSKVPSAWMLSFGISLAYLHASSFSAELPSATDADAALERALAKPSADVLKKKWRVPHSGETSFSKNARGAP